MSLRSEMISAPIYTQTADMPLFHIYLSSSHPCSQHFWSLVRHHLLTLSVGSTSRSVKPSSRSLKLPPSPACLARRPKLGRTYSLSMKKFPCDGTLSLYLLLSVLVCLPASITPSNCDGIVLFSPWLFLPSFF